MSQFFTTENLRAFLEKNPDSMAFAHLGARLIDEGEYQGAIEVCQKGLDKHPEYSFGHFILGTAHYHVKNYTDAKRELEKALAYDPNNPRAWEILSAINEILNLNDDSRESNLQSYLIDFLNKDASSQYIFEIDASTSESTEANQVESPKEVPAHETLAEVVPQEKDAGEMLDDVLAGGEEEYDFDKTLNDVFKEKEEEATADETEQKQTPGQIREDATSEVVPSDKEGMVSADEFTTAIESFFSEYEKEEKESVPEDSKPEVEPEQMTSPEVPPELGSQEISTEQLGEVADTDSSIEPMEEFDPSTLQTKPEGPSAEETAEPLPDIPEESVKPDDELLDFQSFVSDVIQDTSEAPSAGIIQEVPDLPESPEDEKTPDQSAIPSDAQPPVAGDETTSLEENVLPDDTEAPLPVDELEIPKEEEFDSPLPPPVDTSEPVSEAPIVPDDTPIESDAPEVTAKFSKPPILSPTLGEIYLAQGRFEEAINVFKQLLEKDPENSRYKRKISDLENIITKKKLGS